MFEKIITKSRKIAMFIFIDFLFVWMELDGIF